MTSPTPAGRWPLTAPLGLVIPVDPELDGIRLLVDADAETEMVVEVHDPGLPQNYVPKRHVATASADVAAGEKQWVQVPLRWRPEHPQNAFVVIRADPRLTLHTSDEVLPGVLAFTHREPSEDERDTEQWRAWKQVLSRSTPCLELETPTSAFAPSRAVGGYARPWGGPQMWISHPLAHDPEPWLELAWDEPQTVAEVAIVFDDDLDEDLINLHHHRTPFDVLPTLVRDYRVEFRREGGWDVLAEIEGNRVRHRRHVLPAPVSTTRLRLVVTATNGADAARVVSLRAWADVAAG